MDSNSDRRDSEQRGRPRNDPRRDAESLRADDRRERYAAAMYEKANPGFRWIDAVSAGLPDCAYWREQADAAMAVADAENSRVTARYEKAAKLATAWQSNAANRATDNARMRAELTRKTAAYDELVETATNTVDRLRTDLDTATGLGEALGREVDRVSGELAAATDLANSEITARFDAEATIERLRAELESRTSDDIAEGFYDRAVAAEATIERVHAVLDSGRFGPAFGLRQDIRAALADDN
ncbi:hypothetical protein ACFPA8_07730 [Streptomyces ovatisporus]|uniref:Uncharacterized protein n=1 Tax=Streptomyces ovatisporus TaxID=1128682 RepID=A0ABV9A2V2_9ACTN